MRTRLGHALGVAVTVTFATCTTMHRTSDRVSDDPGTMTLTEDQIAQSGASTAWELLRRDVKKYTYAEDQFGRPFSIRSQRGTSSLNLMGADSPMIIIDGARLSDLAALAQLSAGALSSVEVLSGIRGTGPQGTNASAGVIYIHTREASNP